MKKQAAKRLSPVFLSHCLWFCKKSVCYKKNSHDRSRSTRMIIPMYASLYMGYESFIIVL